MRKLSDFADFVSEKIPCSTLDRTTYVGMDNLLPDKAGITESEYVPSEGMATAFRKGDILLGNIRPYFKKIWLAEFNGGCSADVLCLRCKKGVSPEYLFSVLAQDAFFEYDVKGSKGSKMPRGDKNHIMAFPITEIDSPEKAGNLICSIHQKIQNNNSIISELEAMAKDIYDYWFVQFDFPDENGKPYKSSGGKMVWNENLKREIPEGWISGCMGDVLSVENGKDHKHLGEGHVPVYGSGGIMRYANDALYDGEAVLVPRKGTLNNVMYTSGPIWTVDTMFYTVAKRDCLTIFLYYTLSRFDFEKLNTGTGVPSMTSMIIKRLPLVIPDDSILQRFDSHLKPVFEMIKHLSNESMNLASLRDWLLPMLMNGQVKVGKKEFVYEQTPSYMTAASKDETHLNKIGD